MMKKMNKTTVCPYDCPDTCGMIANIDENGTLTSISGDAAHPVTKGILCRKMQHYEKDVHSPERILTPLKRVGQKGDPNAFVPITWDEAISTIGSTWRSLIAAHGAASILPYSYAGTLGVIQRFCGEAFFARLGACKLARTICSDAKGAAIKQVMGPYSDWHSSQITKADLVILWGSNPQSNRLHIVPLLQEARKQGTHIILIDVYENMSASLCDEVITIRPGTDSALLLALMHELERNGHLDMDFIQTHTTGFDALQLEYQNWTLEKASQITGIPEQTIRQLALSYGQAKCPMIVPGNGMSRYTNGGAAVRYLLALPALTGAWMRGGGTSGATGASRFLDRSMIARPDWQKPDLPSINMNQLGNGLCNDHRIRSLYVYNSNPAVMAPDQSRVRKGLSRDDLFVVVHDRYLTDTALFADIVLPSTFSTEHDDIHAAYGHFHVQVSWQCQKPAGEARSNWDTFQLLAREMHFEDDYFKQTARELLLKCLDPENKDYDMIKYPITPEQLQQLQQGQGILLDQPDVMCFGHSDGKIHLSPASHGYQPLLDQNYPLRLVMAHSPWSLNSNFSYREELTRSRGPLRLWIHPSEAAKRHISDRELVTAYNHIGSITVQIEASDKVPAGTAIAAGVYSDRSTFGDGNFSALLSEVLTDIGEASSLNTNSVEIKKKA